MVAESPQPGWVLIFIDFLSFFLWCFGFCSLLSLVLGGRGVPPLRVPGNSGGEKLPRPGRGLAGEGSDAAGMEPGAL